MWFSSSEGNDSQENRVLHTLICSKRPVTWTEECNCVFKRPPVITGLALLSVEGWNYSQIPLKCILWVFFPECWWICDTDFCHDQWCVSKKYLSRARADCYSLSTTTCCSISWGPISSEPAPRQRTLQIKKIRDRDGVRGMQREEKEIKTDLGGWKKNWGWGRAFYYLKKKD